MTSSKAVALIVVAATVSLGADSPRVEFIRPPAFVSDQDVIRFQVRVEPHADNRRLIIAAFDGEFCVRRTDEDLDGANAPRTRWKDLRFPAGDLMIAAIVYDMHGEVERDVRPLRVSGQWD